MVKRNPKSGQAIVFLLLSFTVLIFLLLFQVDLHHIIQRKGQTRNAGDAAALAAARWQGATLNLIGELNLIHALALAENDVTTVDAITNMQMRLCFTGPLTGLHAAQVLAKNNGMRVDEGMTAILLDHAATIDNQYASRISDDGGLYFPEPWPGAWKEYAFLLREIAEDGIAAGPDNMHTFTDPDTGHLLLTKEFYYAVAGYGWCWFKFHAPGLLNSYRSFHDWPPLPDHGNEDFGNAEIFSVAVHPASCAMKQLFTPRQFAERAQQAGHMEMNATLLASTNLTERVENWFFYNTGDWGEWKKIKPDGEDQFPITGPVRPEYDTAGADVLMRVNATVSRFTPGIDGEAAQDNVVWTAAAKPLGYLDGETGKEPVTAAAEFVLPAFRNVRLIPVDATSHAEVSSSDPEWVTHVRVHLSEYLANGPSGNNSCRYCRALSLWESESFHQQGNEWLDEFGGNCRPPTGGGGRGGGTRRGH